LGDNATGLILNISEGGLCVQTEEEIAANRTLPLRLPSLRSPGWVQAQGRIVWQNEARNVAGIEFVDLAEDAQREVRTWLSFGSSLQELRGNWAADPMATGDPAYSDSGPLDVAAEQEQPDLPLSDTLRQPLSSAPLTAGPNIDTDVFDQALINPPPPRSISPLAASALAILLILLAVVAGRHANQVRGIAGWFSRKTVAPVPDVHSSGTGHGSGVAPEPPASLTEVPPPAPAPLRAQTAGPNIPSAPSASQKAGPGAKFALQVAAMKEQENAAQLTQSLRSKNFPAFISRRPGEHLYRVLVGPYPDNQSARAAQNALEKEGLPSITKRWTP
jgi:cell division septation protein DedD